MRPAIATVLILACTLPASAADRSAGVIRVAASYPGADARTVDETVLTPLFSQINGVEGVTRVESEARNDGTGTLTVTFAPRADLDLAQMRVQNGVNLSLRRLPESCRQMGVSVRKFPAGPPAFWLALTSTDDKDDARDLGLFAAVYMKNVLARVYGVADVRIVGVGEHALRVLLNADQLRRYALTVGDVADALRRQNIQAAGGIIGGPDAQYTVTASGRLTKPEQFGNVLLRANASGEVLRLRDVARVEYGSAGGGFARVDGKPAALIAVATWPGRVTADDLREAAGFVDLPPGLRFEVVADRSADRLLTAEVQRPDPQSLKRAEEDIGRAADAIRGLPGRPVTVAFAERHEPDAATILVKLPAAGGPTVADVEKALTAIPIYTARVGVVPSKGEVFPVRLAVTDSSWQGEEPLGEAAGRALERMVKGEGVADLALAPSQRLRVGQHAADLDREKCAAVGVAPDDVFTMLRAAVGGVHATDLHRFGRTWRVVVQVAPEFVRFPEDLAELWVRSATGEMVPLAALLKLRKAQGAATVERVDGHLAVVITAAPAPGKTTAEAAAECVEQAREVLPKGFRAVNLTSPPR